MLAAGYRRFTFSGLHLKEQLKEQQKERDRWFKKLRNEVFLIGLLDFIGRIERDASLQSGLSYQRFFTEIAPHNCFGRLLGV
ncbi:hypothetical protein HNI00_06420 [Thermoleptolyngbya oregonensis NK1-22]|uniref:Uncharacterized protein n=1 Tax=Thermoleptolyngbya oregonensis NK1-22 TaxID=2547457 RepID=A0AA97BPD4_9CYAN|nr:hypothetical protein [Thermoleptolyngbya oregonensis]WOB42823.1 hypothetical protein HNI00_06420 [Thermoleptolyngbya oregonensis NK1-22]